MHSQVDHNDEACGVCGGDGAAVASARACRVRHTALQVTCYAVTGRVCARFMFVALDWCRFPQVTSGTASAAKLR